MDRDNLHSPEIEQLLSSPVGQMLSSAMDVIANLQRNLYALASSEDSEKLTLLKIGTVFSIFLMDTLASGKQPKDFSRSDWEEIGKKVSKYAVLEEGQSYCEFVFTLYAVYISNSAKAFSAFLPKERSDPIQKLADGIRSDTELFQNGRLTESEYVENCLWSSLEAMVKLLSTWLSASLAPLIGKKHEQLILAGSQLAFEYGRYILFSREQTILTAYIQNQRVLDERLRMEYNSYLSQLQEQADRFQRLVDDAFSPGIRDSLMSSASLARAAGVREEEILTSTREVDAFFLD